MSLTIQAVAAELTRKAANDLILTARALPDDRATWQPHPQTRPALEQLAECSIANLKWSNILRTGVDSNLPPGAAPQIYAELDTLDKALTRLGETADALAETILSLSNSDLGKNVSFSWKPELGKPLSICCFHAYWNMVYHLGQISYIQTLYGDTEEHCDAGPFGESDAVL